MNFVKLPLYYSDYMNIHTYIEKWLNILLSILWCKHCKISSMSNHIGKHKNMIFIKRKRKLCLKKCSQGD